MNNFLLDTNIATRLCLPKHPENLPIVSWFLSFSKKNIRICAPEIVVYEARRGLIFKAKKDPAFKGLKRFENLIKGFDSLNLNEEMWLIAANLWAELRYNGKPTAHQESLDGDVLLAAQAIVSKGSIIKENIDHFTSLAPAFHWSNIP